MDCPTAGPAITRMFRDRDVNADQRLDTLIHFHQNQNWELAIPNGLYEVTVEVGDPSNPSTYTLNVEGVNYWNAVALAQITFSSIRSKSWSRTADSRSTKARLRTSQRASILFTSSACRADPTLLPQLLRSPSRQSRDRSSIPLTSTWKPRAIPTRMATPTSRPIGKSGPPGRVPKSCGKHSASPASTRSHALGRRRVRQLTRWCRPAAEYRLPIACAFSRRRWFSKFLRHPGLSYRSGFRNFPARDSGCRICAGTTMGQFTRQQRDPAAATRTNHSCGSSQRPAICFSPFAVATES